MLCALSRSECKLYSSFSSERLWAVFCSSSWFHFSFGWKIRKAWWCDVCSHFYNNTLCNIFCLLLLPLPKLQLTPSTLQREFSSCSMRMKPSRVFPNGLDFPVRSKFVVLNKLTTICGTISNTKTKNAIFSQRRFLWLQQRARTATCWVSRPIFQSFFFASLWCVFWSFAHPKVMNCASHSDQFTSAFNGMFIDNDKNNTERVLCCFVSRVFDELREASNRTAKLLRKNFLCLDRFTAAESDRVVESVKNQVFCAALCIGSFRSIAQKFKHDFLLLVQQRKQRTEIEAIINNQSYQFLCSPFIIALRCRNGNQTKSLTLIWHFHKHFLFTFHSIESVFSSWLSRLSRTDPTSGQSIDSGLISDNRGQGPHQFWIVAKKRECENWLFNWKLCWERLHF